MLSSLIHNLGSSVSEIACSSKGSDIHENWKYLEDHVRGPLEKFESDDDRKEFVNGKILALLTQSGPVSYTHLTLPTKRIV